MRNVTFNEFLSLGNFGRLTTRSKESASVILAVQLYSMLNLEADYCLRQIIGELVDALSSVAGRKSTASGGSQDFITVINSLPSLARLRGIANKRAVRAYEKDGEVFIVVCIGDDVDFRRGLVNYLIFTEKNGLFTFEWCLHTQGGRDAVCASLKHFTHNKPLGGELSLSFRVDSPPNLDQQPAQSKVFSLSKRGKGFSQETASQDILRLIGPFAAWLM